MVLELAYHPINFCIEEIKLGARQTNALANQLSGESNKALNM